MPEGEEEQRVKFHMLNSVTLGLADPNANPTEDQLLPTSRVSWVSPQRNALGAR